MEIIKYSMYGSGLSLHSDNSAQSVAGYFSDSKDYYCKLKGIKNYDILNYLLIKELHKLWIYE